MGFTNHATQTSLPLSVSRALFMSVQVDHNSLFCVDDMGDVKSTRTHACTQQANQIRRKEEKQGEALYD